MAAYRRALDISHLSAPIRMNLALAYYKAARCAEALPELALVLDASPGLYNAVLLSADCHVQMGAFDKAIAMLTPIAAAHAEDDAFNYVLGTALLRNRQENEGAVYLDRILKKGDSAEARLLMGLARRAGSDLTGARDEFARAVALNPQLPMAHSLYGQALLSTGDREGARAAFTKELALNANDFEANLYLGVVLKEEQDYAGARQYFDKALAVRSADPGARYQMATLLVATGENVEAQARLERLVADNPGFTEAHVSLATVYYRLKRKDDGDRHKAIAEKLTAEAQAKQPGRARNETAGAITPMPGGISQRIYPQISQMYADSPGGLKMLLRGFAASRLRGCVSRRVVVSSSPWCVRSGCDVLSLLVVRPSAQRRRPRHSSVRPSRHRARSSCSTSSFATRRGARCATCAPTRCRSTKTAYDATSAASGSSKARPAKSACRRRALPVCSPTRAGR